MSNKISSERKATYYIGLALIAVGFLIFFSGFFSFGSDMHSFSHSGTPSFFKRGVIGMVCIIVGGVLANIGARGAAGSGLILDPEKAREDLKPFNTAKGKMINDVVENIDVVNNLNLGHKSNNSPKEIIKVKCRNCSTLNDEDSKFCKNCGEQL